MSNKIVCPNCMGTGVNYTEREFNREICTLCGGHGEYKAGFMSDKIRKAKAAAYFGGKK